ncbi:MAG: DUF1592 domain-containing protein [Planctomycetota bacterium]|nr:DUF1592 domain-containing protein [Planctomycetota bacterium]MDA1178572.1 DUF1592 domain-containing protein [Planctomycetota bacterium]
MSVTHLIASLVLSFSLISSVKSAQPSVVALPEQHQAFLKNYCVECHNAKTKEGNLQLDDISFSLDSVENAERWQKILNQLNSGKMPPKDSAQPTNDEKTDFLDVLAQTLVNARQSLSDAGGKITTRRLNRREYKNSIRELLGIDIDVSDLPDDRGVGGFDTVGSSLFMSSDQFEQYHALGRRALHEAFARSVIGSEHKARTRRTDHREAEVFAKRMVRHVFNAYYLGGYKQALAWRASDRSKPPSEFGLTDEAEVDYRVSSFEKYGPSYSAYLSNPLADTGSLLTCFSVADEVIALPPDKASELDETVTEPAAPGSYLLRLQIGSTSEKPPKRPYIEMGTRTSNVQFAFQRSFEITGTVEHPQIIEVHVNITADGPRSFVFREKRPISLIDTLFLDSIKRTGVIPDPALWIDWVEWDGPLPTPSDNDKLREILGQNSSETIESARGMIERFATRAFRGRTPDSDFVDRLVNIFATCRAVGKSFEESLQESLSAVLAAPGFLYLSVTKDQIESSELSPLELACRISYFLWSAPPDEQLLAAARSGDLQRPDLLAQQVDRMIMDEKSREFVTGFTHQWLGMERLDFFQFNTTLYPDFDESAKAAMKTEVFATVEHLLRNNGSLSSLLRSDFVVINGLLASYYGIDGVNGDEFRPVSLPTNSPRGGLLGMAAILAMGSNGEVTSPVERGAWVLRKLLNDPPPPAPPNVPQISRLEGKLFTTHERLLAHQEEPQCASCHRKIDPIGLGLENFNAAGAWRTVDNDAKEGIGKKEWTIEPAGAFHNGPSFKNYFELRDLIAARETDFAEGFSKALIEYGLGRPCGFSDHDLVLQIVDQAKTKNFLMREFFQTLIASPVFRQRSPD